MFLDDLAPVRSKVLGGPAYVSWVILHVVLVGVCLGICYKLLPKLETVFLGFGLPLPWPARFFVGLSHLLTGYPIPCLVALGAAVGVDIYSFERLSADVHYPDRVRSWGLLVSLPLFVGLVVCLLGVALASRELVTRLSG